MASTVHGIRVFDPRVGTRDGLEFTATIDGSNHQCFITGTAIGILRGDLQGDAADVFGIRWSEIAMAVSRKTDFTPADQEIVVNSDDVSAPA